MGEQSSADRVKKPCVMCGEPIRVEASKCIHCGSYQHWLGSVSSWTTVLSLLVALIAVTAAAAPVIKRLFTPTAATFRFSAPEFQRGAVFVRATNVGGQSGVLDRAVVMIPQRSAGQPYIYVLVAADPTSEQEIAPGESAMLSFTFDRRLYDPPQVTEADAPCTLEIYDSVRQVSCDEVRFLGAALLLHDSRGELPEEGPAQLRPPADWHRYRD